MLQCLLTAKMSTFCNKVSTKGMYLRAGISNGMYLLAHIPFKKHSTEFGIALPKQLTSPLTTSLCTRALSPRYQPYPRSDGPIPGQALGASQRPSGCSKRSDEIEARNLHRSCTRLATSAPDHVAHALAFLSLK